MTEGNQLVRFVKSIELSVTLCDEAGDAFDTTTQQFAKGEQVEITEIVPWYPQVSVGKDVWEESKTPDEVFCNLHLADGDIILQVPVASFNIV